MCHSLVLEGPSLEVKDVYAHSFLVFCVTIQYNLKNPVLSPAAPGPAATPPALTDMEGEACT